MLNNKKKSASSDFIEGTKQVASGTAKILKSVAKSSVKVLKFSGNFISSKLKYLNEKYNFFKSEKELKNFSSEIMARIELYIKNKFINKEQIFQELDEKDFTNISKSINNEKLSNSEKIEIIKDVYEYFLLNNCDFIDENNSIKIYKLKK